MLPSDLSGSYLSTISQIRAVELPAVRAKVGGLEQLRDHLIEQGAEDSRLAPVLDALTQANENVVDAVGQIEAFTEAMAEHRPDGGPQPLAQSPRQAICQSYRTTLKHIEDVELPAAEAKVAQLERLRDDMIAQGVDESELKPILDAIARANQAVSGLENEAEAFSEEIDVVCF